MNASNENFPETEVCAGSAAQKFWEMHYSTRGAAPSGIPSHSLVQFEGSLPSGRALESGCANGDDTVWLASRGWQVVAVDIAAAAMERARLNAEQAGVSENIDFQRHDLTRSIPTGCFDLVTAIFLHSPLDFPRLDILRRVASAVAPGGLFLIVEQGLRAPWSWSHPDTRYPLPTETLSALQLDVTQWESEFVDVVEREAAAPTGKIAQVKDNVIALRRTRHALTQNGIAR